MKLRVIAMRNGDGSWLTTGRMVRLGLAGWLGAMVLLALAGGVPALAADSAAAAASVAPVPATATPAAPVPATAAGTGAPASAAAPAAELKPVSTLTQYGVTWTFDKDYPSGQFVTGDYYVIGPVVVTAVSPAPAAGRNGSVVNPKAGKAQGYDDRLAGYDAALAAKFPLTLGPGESLVSVASLGKIGDKTPDTVPGQHARGPLRTAVVLTCVEKQPPADAFRPAFVGTQKLNFTAGQLRRDILPRLAPQGTMPDRVSYERQLQRIWLDHLYEWRGREMHPLENMPDYGREIASITSTVGLMLLVDDPKQEHETLLRRYVQLGIDLYGITQSDNNLWPANGGHHAGRKWPIVFAGLMLDHEGMQRVKAAFAEDQQTYVGKGYNGQTALWQIHPALQHEELPPEKWKGPPFKGDNDGVKSEAYRRLNGPTWVGATLAARLMGAKKLWDHDVYFDYVDRWIKEEPLAAKDAKSAVNSGGGEFVWPMWQAYRAKADEIAAQTEARRGVKSEAPKATPVEPEKTATTDAAKTAAPPTETK